MTQRSSIVYAIATLAGLLSLLLLFTGPFGLGRPKGSSGHNNSLERPCGTSPADARRRGCHFDVMQYSWLPPPCYDAELVEDYLGRMEKKQLNFYAEPYNNSLANIIPLSDILTGDHRQVYMNWDQHRDHCSFMFRKLHRAFSAGGPIDGYIWRYKHTHHCLGVLEDTSMALDLIATQTTIKYPSCMDRGA